MSRRKIRRNLTQAYAEAGLERARKAVDLLVIRGNHPGEGPQALDEVETSEPVSDDDA